MSDPVHDAIERGAVAAATLTAQREKLFDAMRAILPIAGVEGLKACVAGVQEAVTSGWRREGRQ